MHSRQEIIKANYKAYQGTHKKERGRGNAPVPIRAEAATGRKTRRETAEI
jgi:hypothetical protein